MEPNAASTSTFVDTFQEALRVPHLQVTLPHNTTMNSIEETLADACCGLLLGERPKVFVDKKHYVAVIPIPPERVERVLYKSYILHKPSGARYQCSFREGNVSVPEQKRISIDLPGAKFAWLKAQSHIRDRLYSYEPLIRVNWQQCTGAEKCKIHLHYSSSDESILREAEALRDWILDEAAKVIVRSFPLYVPPRNRYGLSSDAKFREIAYNHCVSLWTRTMKDSPIGSEWCTLATDDMEQMDATLEAYKEYGMSTKWGSKTSPSTSPPASLNPSPTRRATRVSSSPPDRIAERIPLATRSASDVQHPAAASGATTTDTLSLPPGLNFAPAVESPSTFPACPTITIAPNTTPLFFDSYNPFGRRPSTYTLWGEELPPIDIAFPPAAVSPASFASADNGAACWTQLMSTTFSSSSYSQLLMEPEEAHRILSLTDSNSG